VNPSTIVRARGVGTHRVIFIDLARAMAVVMMVYGHTASALLAPVYRVGPWYDAWQFQRGLTSSLFLLLSGFAFSIATTRHWASHLQLSPAVIKRLRRFGFFVALGYALHFPVSNVAALPTLTAAQWRGFLAVDVLQLVGVTFILIQLLVMAARSRRVFMAISFLLATAIIAGTPWVWRQDWTAVLPLGLAAYLSPANASQFPILPFGASVLIGAGAGQIYARWGASNLEAFANRALLGAGIVLTVAALYAKRGAFDVYGPGPGEGIPSEFVLRTGVSLVILGVIAHASRWISHLPHVFGAVAQESLVVYFIHLCIVYGSVWNRGLVQRFGESLRPEQTLPIVLAMIAAMVLLAWGWNRLKHSRPRLARWTMWGLTAAAGAALLV
jgi:hypothetical protein